MKRVVQVAQFFVSLAVVTSLFTMFPSATFAATQNSKGDRVEKGLKKQDNIRQAYEDGVLKMEPHLYVDSDGMLAHKIKLGKDISISQPLFLELDHAMKETNKQMKAGSLKLADVRLVTEFSGDPYSLDGQVSAEATTSTRDYQALACVGRKGSICNIITNATF